MLASVVWIGDTLAGVHRQIDAETARGASGGPSTMSLTGEYEPSPSEWAREHVQRFEESGGRLEDTPGGMAIVVLTSVGARSGKLRKTPLMRVEHGGEYAVVASLGGAPKHPVWYHNLKKNPHVELQDGPVKRDYRAREVTGEEKAVWWDRAVAAYPDYADYQKKTTREIPVFVLTPMAESENA
jgi:deazaflavin-dependent oxidoreductase (nitroreductase family)